LNIHGRENLKSIKVKIKIRERQLGEDYCYTHGQILLQKYFKQLNCKSFKPNNALTQYLTCRMDELGCNL